MLHTQWNKRKRIIMLSVLLASFMTSVETTIVTTALPSILSSLHGLAWQSWVFTAYLLTTTLSTPIYGNLSDHWGRKPVFLIGLSCFTLGSLASGLAPNLPVLIGARALQGLGAGAVMPITFTLIADTFPLSERSTMMAWNNTAWGISALIGPLLGGFLVDQLSWHWIFFINVPLGMLVFGLIYAGYQESAQPTTTLKLDWRGSCWLAISLMTLLSLLQLLSNQQINWITLISVLLLFLVALSCFIRAESHATNPIIPLTLFHNRTFTIQILTALFLSGMQFGFQIYFPIWLQSIYRVSATVAGLAITPSPIAWLLTSFSVSALMKRWAPKRITSPIVIVQLAFYLTLIFSSTTFPLLMFYIIAGVTGAGLGIIITMNTVVAQAEVPETDVGTASSMITLGRTLGQTIMTGLFGFIFNLTINSGQRQHPSISHSLLNQAVAAKNMAKLKISMTQTHNLDQILLTAFHHVFFLCTLIMVVIILINLLDPRHQPLKMK
ncbi:MDR family MFS transporter [Fructilactobacillus carniphilus]|uniref:MFS transporter n=1 Tax=Fructilactobacillus carniphilus TaxID=2940297 RepID=A0ABY5BZI1_9LACO|nr:MDR family MFS transporter [Fructilactobacillus carniphilus]USS90496.1 MFS transporter [Fructilactobacillus carniphilus]